LKTARFGSKTYFATLVERLRNSPLIAISGINAVLTALSIGLSLLVVRALPKEEYGHLVYFYAGFGLLRLLMNFGLGMSMSRDIAASVHQRDRLAEVVYSTITLRLFSIVGLIGGLVVLAALTNQPYLGYIAAAGIAASVADMVFALITGLRIMRAVGWMTMAQPVMYAGITFALIVMRTISSEALMIAYAFSFVMMAGFGFYFVVRSGLVPRPKRTNFQPSYLRSILLFAVPIYLGTLASQGWSSICAGTLGTRGDFQTSAEFGVVFNLVGLVISITASTLVTTFFPQISQLHSQGKSDKLAAQIRSTVLLLAQGYLFVAIVLFAFSTTIVDVLFSDLYRSSAAYLALLSPIVLTLGLTPIFTLALVGTGRPWHSLIGVGTQLVTLTLLIFGGPDTITPERLSIAALISSAVGLVVSAALCVKTLTWVIIPTRLFAMLVIGVLAAGVLRLVDGQIGVSLSVWHVVVGVCFTLIYWVPILAPRLAR
jgi:O-antigen/teichoic acid export membrane protein